MEIDSQVLSGKLIDVFGLEDEGEGGFRWFIVETNISYAGGPDSVVAFSCYAEGHNAITLPKIPIGSYVEVEGHLVLEMVDKGESNIWFDVDSIDYIPPQTKVRL